MGALEGSGLQFKLLDYVPCYRSSAGTGNAMAFGNWANVISLRKPTGAPKNVDRFRQISAMLTEEMRTC